MMRLQKYLAVCGTASRRKAEEIIKDGRVSVNGKIVREMGVVVNEDEDKIEVDGKTLVPEKRKRYILLNKPKGYITTASDQFGRATVMELIADVSERVYPIGRLDYDTEGLLLMTNDGDFANSIAHPKNKINKIYIASVSGGFDERKAIVLRNGTMIDDKKTAPAVVKILKTDTVCEVMVTIHEGRNRQVRKMFESVGCHVCELRRISVGKFNVGNLPIGKWRDFNETELQYMNKYKIEG